MKTRQVLKAGSIAVLTLLPTQMALGGAHTWDVVEVFSTADGTVQFIELREMNGTNGEWHVQGLQVSSDEAGMMFTFPANLPANTANRHLLLATQSFADLPGAPTPDHIIPGNFFDPTGDTIRYHVYDAWTIPAGAVPTDCVTSLNRDGSTNAPTPTNYNGETNMKIIDACPAAPCPGDLAGDKAETDGTVNVFDLLALLANWGTANSGAALAEPNGVVNLFDLLELLAQWGPCEK